MRDELLLGARIFDEGRFFEAHEAWESKWLVEQDEGQRQLLQGLIQIAAGLHKMIDKHAADSATRLVGRGLAKLDACSAAVVEAELEDFREAVRALAEALAAGRFEWALVPRMNRASP